MLKVCAVVAILVPSLGEAEPCAVLSPQPEVIGPTTAEVTADGGVIIGMVQRMERKAGDPTTWKLRGGKPSAIKVAPGLYTIKAAGTAELVDGTAKKRATIKLATKPEPALAAPEVASVVSGTSKARHPSSFVTVRLKAPAPANARVLVIEDGTSNALSWGETAGGTEIVVYTTDGGCVSQFPDGTVMARPNDTVKAYWLDRYGRRSPESKLVTVSAAP